MNRKWLTHRRSNWLPWQCSKLFGGWYISEIPLIGATGGVTRRYLFSAKVVWLIGPQTATCGGRNELHRCRQISVEPRLSPQLPDKIEMLQFRLSRVLKELSEATVKFPLSSSRHKTWLSVRCIGTASVDSGAVSPQLKLLQAASHRPAVRTASFVPPIRSYCAKTEGAVELDEQLKKDGFSSREHSDK